MIMIIVIIIMIIVIIINLIILIQKSTTTTQEIYGTARPVSIISSKRCCVIDDSEMHGDTDQLCVNNDIMRILPHSSTFADCVGGIGENTKDV